MLWHRTPAGGCSTQATVLLGCARRLSSTRSYSLTLYHTGVNVLFPRNFADAGKSSPKPVSHLQLSRTPGIAFLEQAFAVSLPLPGRERGAVLVVAARVVAVVQRQICVVFATLTVICLLGTPPLVDRVLDGSSDPLECCSEGVGSTPVSSLKVARAFLMAADRAASCPWSCCSSGCKPPPDGSSVQNGRRRCVFTATGCSPAGCPGP